jgi:hypothetical protein
MPKRPVRRLDDSVEKLGRLANAVADEKHYIGTIICSTAPIAG